MKLCADARCRATVQVSKRVVDDVGRDFADAVQIFSVHIVFDDHKTSRHQQNRCKPTSIK